MSIPDYQSIMLPLLRYAEDKREHSLREAIDELAKQFKLTEQERKKLLPSGQQEVFNNRVGWARTYMKKAGLLQTTRRGYFKITDRGTEALKEEPERIDVHFLEQYKEFRQFRALRHRKEEVLKAQDRSEETPEEALESAYQRMRDDLGQVPIFL
jgi:restriction system protein